MEAISSIGLEKFKKMSVSGLPENWEEIVDKYIENKKAALLMLNKRLIMVSKEWNEDKEKRLRENFKLSFEAGWNELKKTNPEKLSAFETNRNKIIDYKIENRNADLEDAIMDNEVLLTKAIETKKQIKKMVERYGRRK